MEQKTLYWISTGHKGVMYTLWRQIVGTHEDGSCFRGRPLYIKNLPMAEEAAVLEGAKYATEHGGEFRGIEDQPFNERSNSFDYLGVHFSRRKFRNGVAYIGAPTPEFWEAWKTRKEEIRRLGFSISKYEDIWNVFYNGTEIPVLEEVKK